MKAVLSFGETLWDLLPTGPMLGGAPFNFAYRINSLGDRGIIVTRLGRDGLGQRAFDQMKALGMDTSFVQWDVRKPTGTVPVTVDPQGNPNFTILPDVAYDFIERSEALIDFARRADCICFGTLAQRTARSQAALKEVLNAAGCAVRFLDINLRKDCFSDETIRGSLEQADILKLNEGEARYLSDRLGIAPLDSARDTGGALLRTTEALLRTGSLKACLVTLGERGALAVTASEKVYVPGYKVKVVDACGSGDAFSAGFLNAHLAGRPLVECCRRGNALGARVAMQPGATGLVAPDEIDRFLSSPPERCVETELRDLATYL